MTSLPSPTPQQKVLITHRVHSEVIERLAGACDVDHNDTGRILSYDETRHRARDAVGIIAFMTDRVDDGFLAACPRLRIVAGAFKGFDNIDVDACTRRGVWVTCVPNLLTVPTAELAIGLLLGLTRNIVSGDRLIRNEPYGGWQPILYGTGILGKCLGLYGMGSVGQAIAARLTGFGMRLIYHDPSPLIADGDRVPNVRRVAFEELLAESDMIVAAAPLTADNLHAFDETSLGRMKRGTYLVNVGRGSVVDEQAVARALRSGRLAGYGSDVYEMEDQSRAIRPKQIEPDLISAAERTVLTPHLGSAVDAVRLAIEIEAANNILALLRGEPPPGAVNRPRV